MKGDDELSGKNKVAPKFNLVDEPWVKCEIIQGDGTFVNKTLGLRELFQQAHQLSGLAGESKAQDLAVLRLLLAILHAVYTRTPEYLELREDGDIDGAVEMWNRLYSYGRFREEVLDYLESVRDSFYLFHPERPFYQVVGVDKAIDDKKLNAVRKMIGTISESENTPKLSLPRNIDTLEYDEAARWLLFMNAFDDAGITKGGACWVGSLGNIYLTGGSLFDTLMLNFVLFDSSRSEVFWGSGEATWELAKPRTEVKKDLPQAPNNQVELLTLQSRRIFLIDDGQTVKGFKMQAGDRLIKGYDISVEQFTALKRSVRKGIEVKEVKRLSLPQFFWRGFASILGQDVDTEKEMKAGVLRWLDELIVGGLLEQKDIAVSVLQVQYHATMLMSIVNIYDDSFPVNTLCLTGSEADMDTWLGTIKDSIKDIEKLANAYGRLVYDINQAKGMNAKRGKLNDIKNNEQVLLYNDLGVVFSSWLSGLDYVNDGTQQKCKELVLSAEGVVQKYGRDKYDYSGRRAMEGIIRKDSVRLEVLNSVQAYDKFRRTVYEIIREGGYKE